MFAADGRLPIGVVRVAGKAETDQLRSPACSASESWRLFARWQKGELYLDRTLESDWEYQAGYTIQVICSQPTSGFSAGSRSNDGQTGMYGPPLCRKRKM